MFALAHSCIRTISKQSDIFCTLSCFDVDQVDETLALTRFNKLCFDVNNELGWLSYDYGMNIMVQVHAYESITHGGRLIQAKVRVT